MANPIWAPLSCDIEPTSGWIMFNRVKQWLGKAKSSHTKCKSILVESDLGLGEPRRDQDGLSQVIPSLVGPTFCRDIGSILG